MAQPDITIYHMPFCPYCGWAKQLLDGKGARYTLIDITGDDLLRGEMEDRSGRNTVPQIFIGEYHVGGFDDLSALERKGELDPLLNGESPA
jgi:glutaredoxin 3